MTEKEQFIVKLKQRTTAFAVDVIHFCESLLKNKASAVITYQLVKSATSTGANYRSACRARSKPEFLSKLCIVVEEADETEYWFEIINEANLASDTNELDRLIREANEITKIMTKAKDTAIKNKQTK
jgi:four helix bundle protein